MEMQIPTSKEIPTQKEKVKEKQKEQKPRKKTLPVKYNQMLVFGYWMLGNMKSEESISNDVFESMMRKLHIFDGTELQIEYLDNFMRQFPELNKQLKKDARSKVPSKAQKEKTKEKKRPGRPRKEKKIVTVESMDIIAELVAEAQREEMATSSEMEIDEESEEEEEEEIIVQKFIFRDVLYLIDDKNTIYDFTEHGEIGTWNEEKKSIDFFQNEKTN